MTGQQRTLAWIALVALFLLCVYALRDILLPFVMGMAFAYFLDPVCDWIERRGVSRTVATTIVTVIFLLLVLLALGLLLPVLYGQIVDFLGRLPTYISMIEQHLTPLIAAIREEIGYGNVPSLQEMVGGHIGDAARIIAKLMGRVVGGIGFLANFGSIVVVMPIVTFFLLRDWDRMMAEIDSWLPRAHADTIRQQIALVDQTLAGFVRGQMLVCLMLGTFYAVALTAAGLDFGALIGLGAGILSIVPYVGTTLGFLVSIGVAFAQFDSLTHVFVIAGIFVLGQIVEGNFLTPRLVGRRVRLHPVWVIFALLAGGSLFGFVGILIAVPVAAVIGVAVRFALGKYLDSQLYKENDAPAPKDPSSS